jgi:hypothetical protein
VGPTPVIHSFGAKEALFDEALRLPIVPSEVYARGVTAGPDKVGATIVRAFLEAWERPQQRLRLTASCARA